MKHLDSGTQNNLGQAVQEVEWLVRILTEEIPSRQNYLISILDELSRIPSLEAEIGELSQTIKEKDLQIEALKAEVQAQVEFNKELEQQKNELNQEIDQFVEERKKLHQEILTLQNEIQQREQALAEVGSIRKVLNGIYQKLRGRTNDSSISM